MLGDRRGMRPEGNVYSLCLKMPCSTKVMLNRISAGCKKLKYYQKRNAVYKPKLVPQKKLVSNHITPCSSPDQSFDSFCTGSSFCSLTTPYNS